MGQIYCSSCRSRLTDGKIGRYGTCTLSARIAPFYVPAITRQAHVKTLKCWTLQVHERRKICMRIQHRQVKAFHFTIQRFWFLIHLPVNPGVIKNLPGVCEGRDNALKTDSWSLESGKIIFKTKRHNDKLIPFILSLFSFPSFYRPFC